jgi:hypothetical protein
VPGAVSVRAGFCRRILELAVSNSNPVIEKVVDRKQITNVLRACEKENRDEKPIDFDESVSFVICAESFTPIVRGKPVGEPRTLAHPCLALLRLSAHIAVPVSAPCAVRCPYCSSSYKAEYDGQLCRTCKLSKIGAEASGLRSFPTE